MARLTLLAGPRSHLDLVLGATLQLVGQEPQGPGVLQEALLLALFLQGGRGGQSGRGLGKCPPRFSIWAGSRTSSALEALQRRGKGGASMTAQARETAAAEGPGPRPLRSSAPSVPWHLAAQHCP